MIMVPPVASWPWPYPSEGIMKCPTYLLVFEGIEDDTGHAQER